METLNIIRNAIMSLSYYKIVFESIDIRKFVLSLFTFKRLSYIMVNM
jgi:hypothetical protein